MLTRNTHKIPAVLFLLFSMVACSSLSANITFPREGERIWEDAPVLTVRGVQAKNMSGFTVTVEILDSNDLLLASSSTVITGSGNWSVNISAPTNGWPRGAAKVAMTINTQNPSDTHNIEFVERGGGGR